MNTSPTAFTLASMPRAHRLKAEGGIFREELKREACWTESLAVGSAGFVERIRPLILNRRETEIVEEQPGLWVL